MDSELGISPAAFIYGRQHTKSPTNHLQHVSTNKQPGRSHKKPIDWLHASCCTPMRQQQLYIAEEHKTQRPCLHEHFSSCCTKRSSSNLFPTFQTSTSITETTGILGPFTRSLSRARAVANFGQAESFGRCSTPILW